MSRPLASLEVVDESLFVRPLVGDLKEMKILGATWDRGRSEWRLPASRMHVESVRDLLVDVTVVGGTVEPLNQRATRVELEDDRLFDWQVPVARKLADSEHGMLLCATPGLGKTAMSIVAADAAVPEDQVLVVAPAKLLRTWEREIRKWCRGEATVDVLKGTPDWTVVGQARWLLVSWDVFTRHQDWFDSPTQPWPLWILDESVMAKSRRSTRAMAVKGGTRRRTKADGTVEVKRWTNLRKSVRRVWLLSGSPTTRHADDLWSQLAMIWPRAFPSYWRFAERYCHVEETVWAKTVIGTRKDRDAVRDNEDLIVVVDQESVIDLPEYLFEAVDVDLLPRQARAFEEMLKDYVATLDDSTMLVAENRMAQLVALQQITSYWQGESAKHDALVSLVEAGVYEAPHLIWTHWREGADALTHRVTDAGLRVEHVMGGMSEKTSDRMIEDYKAGKLDALVLSVGVGKFGHTLTNTRTVHWVDKTFNADDYVQGLRRVRRIGLTWRPVSVTYRAPFTTDDLIEMNLEGKIDSIARVTNASLRELLLGLGRDGASPARTPARLGR